jgi:NAD(P)-dependent dehydrogenase (short-subunit alcohol dehydrogenase family)
MTNSKIALVTGANRGLGKEVCRQLAEQGYLVILTSRTEEKGRAALADIAQEGLDIVYHQLDVNNQQSIATIKEWIINTYGRLDVLVNNAGINYDTWHNALDADLEECHETIEANLFGPWRMAQTFIPLMQEKGFGRVVNLSSGAGALNGMDGGKPAYAMSKAALNVLTIKLAHLTANDNILVNAVCPGWVRTDMGGKEATRSIPEGAKGIVWAATIEDGGPTGGFFRDGERIAW